MTVTVSLVPDAIAALAAFGGEDLTRAEAARLLPSWQLSRWLRPQDRAAVLAAFPATGPLWPAPWEPQTDGDLTVPGWVGGAP